MNRANDEVAEMAGAKVDRTAADLPFRRGNAVTIAIAGLGATRPTEPDPLRRRLPHTLADALAARGGTTS